MRCNLTVLFVIATALVILVFAWIAAVQGNNNSEVTNENIPSVHYQTGAQTSWWE